jgi:lipase
MQLKTFEWGDPSLPPLIAIHGVGSHGRSWRKVAEERWSQHHHVIAVDLRGHGDSGWEPPWTNATYVADLIETIDALGLDQPDWVGLSFGGRLLMDMAATHPERIRRAALLEPVIQIAPELAMHRANQELTGDVWDSVEAFLGSRENTGDDVDEELAAEAREQFEPLPDGRIRRKTSQAAIVAIFSEFAVAAPPPETLGVPALLLYAPAFGLVTPEQLAAYRGHVEEVVEVPGLHAVLWSAFEETSAAVTDFLTRA